MTGLELLAFKLAVLTFHIGVLIYLLPLPVHGVKRWAPILIADSMAAALLVGLYAVMIRASRVVAELAGGSWELLEDWIMKTVAYATLLKALSSAVGLVSDKIGVGKPLASIVASALGDFAYAMIVIVLLLSALAMLAVSYGEKLVLVGLVLYAIPFRIAKPAGAWLISFVLVFNAGLPLLPIFIEAVGGAPDLDLGGGYSLASFEVEIYGDKPLPAGLLRIYSSDGELLAIYPIRGGKSFSPLTELNFVAIPSWETVKLEVTVLATRFTPNPSAINPEELGELAVVELELPWITWSPTQSLMLYSTVIADNLDEGVNYATAAYSLRKGDFVEVVWTWGCEVNIDVIEKRGRIDEKSGFWKWEGYFGRYYYIEAVDDYVEIEVSVEYNPDKCGDLEGLEERAKDYRLNLIGILDFITIDLAKAILIYYITLPFAYISVLFIATTGLARVLGGAANIKLKFS